MKQLFFLLLFSGLCNIGSAQLFDDSWEGGGGKYERVRAQRVAYITERLQLTPEEAQTFWPMVNELEAKLKAVKARYRSDKRIESMTNTEAKQFIDQQLKREQELQTLRAEYIRKATAVIPAQKVILFPKADREFKRDLLNRLRNRR